MLTPLDIHNKEFKKGMRGYNIDEVDEFLDEIIRDFEALYKENLDLKDKMQKQEENINQYKEIENALQNTLVLAQKISEEVKQNAQKEAELFIWEARKKAEQIIAGTQDDITESIKKLEKLSGIEKQLFVKIKSFLMTQLELVENYDLEVEVKKEVENKAQKVIEEVHKEARKKVEELEEGTQKIAEEVQEELEKEMPKKTSKKGKTVKAETTEEKELPENVSVDSAGDTEGDTIQD